MARSKGRWCDGTTLLGALLERFAPGLEVTITRAEVERLGFGTRLPVVFILADDGESVRIKVERAPPK
jgi:hypothetical protein